MKIVEIMKTDELRLSQRILKYKGTFFIYGQILNREDELKIDERLYEETNQDNTYRVIEFPMVRKSLFKDDHNQIIIKPDFNHISIDDYQKTLEERKLCKRINEVLDIS